MPPTFAAFGKPMEEVRGPSVWRGDEIAKDHSWRYQLSADTLKELHGNLKQSDILALPYSEISIDNFPLPSFASQGQAIAQQLGSGRGIARLSGLDVENYTTDELKTVFCGISAYIGVTVSQSHLGDYIGEVMDFRDANDERRYHNGGEFVMHRDPTADVTGLLSIRKSMSGGESRLMSAGLAHNILLNEFAELMPAIYRGFPYQRTTPDRGTTSLYTPHSLPVFDFTPEGEFSSHYIPYFSEAYQQRDQLPDDHIEVQAQRAIKHVLWERPELYIESMMQPGDLQFSSNRVVLHSRTDYVDHPEIERARLLLRVWLQLTDLSTVPDHMQMFANRDRADGGIAKAATA